MDRKRYTPEQIITILREAEVLHSQGFKMADVYRSIFWHLNITFSNLASSSFSGVMPAMKLRVFCSYQVLRLHFSIMDHAISRVACLFRHVSR